MLSTSTSGVLLKTLSNLHNGTSQYANLSNQTATGVKSENLADYTGSDARKLIDAQTQTARLTAYNNSIDLVSTRLSAYDTILSSMNDLVTNVKGAITSQQAYDSSDATNVVSQINNVMTQMTSYLNEQVGGRYLFGGADYSAAPVNDDIGQNDTSIPGNGKNSYTNTASDSPADPTILTSSDSTLPDYMASTATSNVWTVDSFSPEQSKTVTYGISAADGAFQKIIVGLQLAKAATLQGEASTTDGTTAYQNYRTKGLEYLTDGLADLKGLQTSVSLNNKSVDASKTLNNTFISILADQTENISGVDTAEVGAKLTALETQLKATYSVTSKLQGLSLVSYL